MKYLPLFFLFLLETLSASPTPEQLKKIAIYGDVPNIGWVDLDGERSLTLKEILEFSGFDLSKLETSKRPYPVLIKYHYAAQRNGGNFDLENKLQESLQTTITIGAWIDVFDFPARTSHLEELESQLDDGWREDPVASFQRLQRTVLIRRQVDKWQQPENAKTLPEYKAHYLSKLSLKSRIALRRLVLTRIGTIANLWADNSYAIDSARQLINEQFSWIDPGTETP